MITGTSRRRLAIAISYGFFCHSLFILGVGSMIFMMFFGMSRSFGHLSPPWNFVANALLLLQFPIGHSLLLTRQGSAILRRLAPAGLGTGLSTTTYVVIASLQVLALFLLWSPSGTIWWRAEGLMLVILSTCYSVAWLTLLKAIADAGFALQVGLLGWHALARNIPVRYPPMPQSGLFKICRQPIYVAFALTLWTVPTWTPDQLTVACVLTFYCLVGPLFKEARFRRRYAQEFEAYRRRVPYWLPWRSRRR
jgi:protein-S-isoprenylcysteine O-methyltransferase Ste14